jgi:bacterioferritin
MWPPFLMRIYNGRAPRRAIRPRSDVATAGTARTHYFLQDIMILRNAAAALMRVAEASRAASVSFLLQILLGAELVSLRRYNTLAASPLSLDFERLREEFEARARHQRRHMLALAERIEALGGVPDFAPDGLASCGAAVLAVEPSLLDILSNNLLAERAIIELYRFARAYLAGWDKESAAMLLLLEEERQRCFPHEVMLPQQQIAKAVLH